MTPADLKAARRQLEVSQAGLATLLGMGSPNAERTVRRWEDGDNDIPGPVVVLLRIWTDPRCPRWAKPVTTPTLAASGRAG